MSYLLKNSPVVSACLLMLLQCAGTGQSIPSASLIRSRETGRRHEHDGYCDIHLRKKSVRTALRIIDTNDSTVALCTDEFGVTLAHTAIFPHEIIVRRYWPPLSKKYAGLIGIAARAFALSRDAGIHGSGVFSGTLSGEYRITGHAGNGQADSATISRNQTIRYYARFDTTGMVLLGRSLDTLLQCRLVPYSTE